MGRATSFTDEIAAEIIERISQGEPLATMCRDEHMPAWRTVYDWMEADAEFAAGIARARDHGYDVIAAECLDIADDGSADYKFSGREGVEIQIDSEHVQRSKLRIETRLKLLAKWSPKKYGDRQQVSPTTPDGEPLQMAPIMFVPVEAKQRDD